MVTDKVTLKAPSLEYNTFGLRVELTGVELPGNDQAYEVIVCPDRPVICGTNPILIGVQPWEVLEPKSIVGFANTLITESLLVKALHPIESRIFKATDLKPVRPK